MKRSSHFFNHQTLIGLTLLVLCLVTLGVFNLPRRYAPNGMLLPSAAIERAQSAESYRFTADITQNSTPTAAVANIGQRSRQDQAYLEGDVNQVNQTLNLRLWSQGGSVRDPSSALELDVQSDGTARGRKGSMDWQPIENVTQGFAPGGSFINLLDVAEGFTPLPNPGDGTQRYAFMLNSAGFQQAMRAQFEQAMRAQGTLPAGAALDLSQAYAGVSGTGELWIGADGLPIRQSVQLAFPRSSTSVETVSSTIDIYYTYFGAPISPLTAFTGWLDRENILERLIPLLVLLAASLLMVRYRASRRVQTAVAAVLIAALLTTPLLQSAQYVAFAEAQTKQQALQAEQQQTQAQVAAQDRAATFNPNLSPLPQSASPSNRAAQGDSDNDGLGDAIETKLGTSITSADSDGDSISDKQETQGFSYNNQNWYLDPLAADSNNDGIDDLREWNRAANLAALPADTDGDGTPDLFDADNDGDEVADRFDLSPFTNLGSTFGPQQPFGFKLPDLQPGKLTYVEFQVRPTNSQRLWYALNVLDWPKDGRGNIQDIDTKTFADTGDTAMPNNRNGDLKLLPMLEIRMDADEANQANFDQDLKPYGITIRNYDPQGKTKIAYVPLTIVTDQQESRVAFSGKMIYRSTGTWTKPHQVRMVWMVQALLDVCARASAANNADCESYATYNSPQIVQIYPEAGWRMTGMNVQEQYGTDVALIYEDRALDPAPTDDTPLIALATGLERSFLVGRDSQKNGKRDIAIDPAKGDTSIRRFDGSMATLAQERWNLPGYLRVKPLAYPQLDLAVKDISGVQTKALLQNYPPTSNPVFLFANEYHFRATNMDTLGYSEFATTWNGQGGRQELTLMINQRQATQAVQTIASLNLAAYCNVQNQWQACNPTSYLALLEGRLSATVAQQPDPSQAWGEITVAETYYAALQRGLLNVVQLGAAVSPAPAAEATDEALAAQIGQGLTKGTTWIINQVVTYMGAVANPQALMESIGNIRRNTSVGVTDLSRLSEQLKGVSNAGKSNRSLGALTVALTLPTITVAQSSEPAESQLKFIYRIGKGSFDSGLSGVKILISVFNIVKEVGQSLAPRTAASSFSIISAGSVFSLVSLVADIGITWGVMLIQAAINGVNPTSLEFYTLVAETLAATILTLIVFAATLTPFGVLAISIIKLIIGITNVVCAATQSQNFFCGISNQISEVIQLNLTKLFKKELIGTLTKSTVTQGELSVSLVKPENGLTDGNALALSIPINTAFGSKLFKDFEGTSWAGDRGRIREDLPRTTFSYELSSVQRSITANLNGMYGDWRISDNTVGGYPGYDSWTASKSTTVNTTIPLRAGLDQHVPVYLNVGYAIPSRTFVWPFWYWDPSGTTGNLSIPTTGQFMLDVLPASLETFYALSGDQNGVRLAWDQRFEYLADADGDGLLSKRAGGIDPDDRSWDSDLDGLSDAYELQLAARGVRIRADRADTDGDGLTDTREVVAGSDPGQADSDRDGLSDAQELNGWMIMIEGQQFKVKSLPTVFDSDNDGFSDGAEFALAATGQNPRVSDRTAYTLSSQSSAINGIVGPGMVLNYTATVENQLGAEWSNVLVTTTPPAFLGSPTTSSPLVLFPNSRNSVQRQWTIPSGIPSQAFVLRSDASATVGPVGSATIATFTRQHNLSLQLDGEGPGIVISSLTNEQRVQVAANQQLVIGGTATDQFSAITSVEVRVNNGAWQPASGQRVWSYGFAPTGEGRYTIEARATDALGNLGGSASIAVVVDNTPPQMAGVSSGQLFANRNTPNGTWRVLLSGTASDPTVNGQSGSGVRSVEARLITTSQTSNDPLRTTDWQVATLNGNSWALNYIFPEGVDEPTGAYRFMIRSTDNVENASAEIATSGTVILDNTAPQIGYGAQPLNTATQATYAFEERPGATFFDDSSERGHGASCATTACPAIATGKLGNGVQFDGLDDRIDAAVNVSESSYGVGLWFKTSSANGGLFVVNAGQSHDRNIWLQNGNLCARLYAEETICSSGQSFADGQWHQVVHTFGGSVGGQRLYVDGTLRATGSKASSDFGWQTNIAIGYSPFGGFFNGTIDEVRIVDRGLQGPEITTLANPLPASPSVLLPLDEASNVSSFTNLAGDRRSAQCSRNNCPLSIAGVPGRPDRAMFFSDYAPVPSYSDYLTLGNADKLGLVDNSFTVAAWVRGSLFSGDRTILGQDAYASGSQLHLAMRDGKPLLAFYGNDLQSDTTLNPNTWYHIAMRYDLATGEQAIFINGQLDKRQTGRTALRNPGPLVLGRWNNAGYFQGVLDEVAIYPRALAQNEIQALMGNTISAYGPLPNTIINPQTFGGMVADVGPVSSGINKVEYALIPTSRTAPNLRPLNAYAFNEPVNATSFANWTSGSIGLCAAPACPAAGVAGKYGNAVQFDGLDDRIDAAMDVSESSYGVGLWFKTSSANGGLFVVNAGQSHDRNIWLQNGNLCARLYAEETICSSGQAFADGQWHQVVHTFGGSVGGQRLYVDGTLRATGSKASSDFGWQTNIAIGYSPFGGFFNGTIDEVEIYGGALTDIQARVLGQPDTPQWRLATLNAATGTASARWEATIPGDLAGQFQLMVRATDMLGQQTILENVWAGEIDTVGPKARITYVDAPPQPWWGWWYGGTPNKIFTYSAESYNLNPERVNLCGNLPTQYTYAPPSYPGETPRLIKMTQVCEAPYVYGPATSADRFGREVYTATPVPAPATRPALVAVANPDLLTALISPTSGMVLTATVPISLQVGLYARSTLKDYALTANNTPVASQSWANGAITSTVTTSTWTPPAEGVYVLQSTLYDWDNRTATAAATVTVDLTPPTVTLATTVVTQSAQIKLDTSLDQALQTGATTPVTLRGSANDANGVQFVDIRTVGTDWQAAIVEGSDWRANLIVESGTYTVNLRAVDQSGLATVVTTTLLVDTSAPKVPQPILTWVDAASQTHPLSANTTITEAGVRLNLDWAAASDDAGIAVYFAGWSSDPAADESSLVAVGPGGPRHVEIVAGEAQTLYAYLISVDNLGNRSVERFGPLYVDAPATPDITTLDYHGWMDAARLIGISRAVSNSVNPDSVLQPVQSLYATWDTAALRMAWTGGDWDGNGDLFVYLDTVAGGTGGGFNPFTSTAALQPISLPGNAGSRFSATPMSADYLVWVSDSQTARLLRWDGASWQFSATLNAGQYGFDRSNLALITDLRIPFSQLGITNPASSRLGMVAFASDEGALRVWSVLPASNPLNSQQLSSLNTQTSTSTLALRQQYQWPALAANVQVSANLNAEAAAKIWITTEQPAVTASVFDPDLDDLWNTIFADKTSDPSDYLTELRPELPRLGQGQTISYTLHYTNDGSAPSSAITVSLESRRSLRLDGATHKVDPAWGGIDTLDVVLNPIAPGETGTYVFTGTINTANVVSECPYAPASCADFPAVASLNAFVYDASLEQGGEPLDWVWIDSKVDIYAPEALTIDEPQIAIPAGASTVYGFVDDESPISTIEVQVRNPTNTIATFACPDSVDVNGEWGCAIDVGTAANGAAYALRSRATDTFGQSSAWTTWKDVVVDTEVPQVMFDAESLALSGTLLLDDTYLLGGSLDDNLGVAYVEVCQTSVGQEDCFEADLEQPTATELGAWWFDLTGFAAADAQPEMVTVSAVDVAGNRSPTLLRLPYLVDNIGPQITVTSVVSSTQAGGPVLAGTVSDNGGVTKVWVMAERLNANGQPLLEDPQWERATLVGSAWSYTPAVRDGNYRLFVLAVDSAGNVSDAADSYPVLIDGLNGYDLFLPMLLR